MHFQVYCSCVLQPFRLPLPYVHGALRGISSLILCGTYPVMSKLCLYCDNQPLIRDHQSNDQAQVQIVLSL